MGSLRTPELEEAYRAFRAALPVGVCHLCDDPAVQTFNFWKIISDKFPYDKIAAKHDMLVPLRHTVESELTPEEKEEFSALKKDFLNTHYELLIETALHLKSVPEHHHVHLIIIKE